MMSNYDDKSSMGEAGKRHFHKERKTSLFGSESPRAVKVDHGRRTVPSAKTNVVEGNIISYKEQALKEQKYINPIEKRKVNCSQEQNNNRQNWEYEQELKRMNGNKNTDDKSYSTVDDNLRLKERNFVNKNEIEDDEYRQKYEEAKAYDDHLDQEIQKMKLKQMEDKYLSMRNDINGKREEENEDDSLYREAENRARLRDIERFNESHGQHNDHHESSLLNNHLNEEYSNGSHHYEKEIPRLSLQRSEPKKTSSSTHNDFRQYSMEEYMNSRQPLVNPTQLKRTTLSGSEELSRNGQSIKRDIIANLRPIESENVNRFPKNASTYNNIFPTDRMLSTSKSSGPYSMKTPYATD